jgi:hypothetical protein
MPSNKPANLSFGRPAFCFTLYLKCAIMVKMVRQVSLRTEWATLSHFRGQHVNPLMTPSLSVGKSLNIHQILGGNTLLW